MINESESGLSILTLKRVEVGSVLRIYCKDRDVRCARVIWCEKKDIDIYIAGLFYLEQ